LAQVDNEIIYNNGEIELKVSIDKDTVWLNANDISSIFDVNRPAVVKHIGNIYKTDELDKNSSCSILEQVASDGKRRKMNLYNLDMIISVGYRVNSIKATQFRQWATQRLKDYLVQGYAINEKRLSQKQQEVDYLKTGIRIVSRAIEEASDEQNQEIFKIFSKGLALLDDYDNEELDISGQTKQDTRYPSHSDYMNLIHSMYSDFESDVFAKTKDDGFYSSINQIKQSFGGSDCYPSIEEKAANLLYFITKNHSFVDGNKRIAAACFTYFLEQNNQLIKDDGTPIVDNNTLAALTLFIATSKTDESEIVKRLVISILNRSR